MTRLFLALLVFVLGLGLAQANAEKRLALVVGINDYKEVPALEKAVGDAEAISTKLTGLGFGVTTILNADRRSLNRALTQFYSTITPGDTVLFHYSGHGVAIEGQNYLLPADIPEPGSGQTDLLKVESLPLATLVDTFKAKGAGVSIFIIDACRDNPFATAGKRSLGSTRGLGSVEPPKGSFIMFSAGLGQAALDRLSDADTEKTSVYMRVLLSRFDQPNMKLRDLAASVREEVDTLAKTAGHEQRPAYYDDLPEDFSITGKIVSAAVPAPVVEAPVAPEPAPQPQPTSRGLTEEQAFQLAQGIDTPASWDAFLSQYPDSPFAPFAEAAKAKLLAALAPKPKPAKPKPIPQPQAELEEEPAAPAPSRTLSCNGRGTVRGLIEDSGDGFLLIRSGPGTRFQELDRLFNGDTVPVCGFDSTRRWVKIRFGGGRIGWASKKYLATGG
jgi:hypothetical protein